MIYGYSLTLNDTATTLVVAADDIDELKVWQSNTLSKSTEHMGFTKPTFIDYMQQAHLKGLKNYCIQIAHTSSQQQEAFFDEVSVVAIPSAHAIDYQVDMIESQRIKDDPESAGAAWVDEHGKTSIAAIYGLTEENDRWDKRTAEEKEEDLKNRAGNSKAMNDLMGESFSFDNKEQAENEGLSIQDILQQGGLINVSATKNGGKAGAPVQIQLTPEKTKELEDIKSKVSADIYQEKYKTALIEQGLQQIGLSNDQIEQVMTTIAMRNLDIGKILVDIQRGDFDYNKFNEEQIKTAMVGDDYSRNELAERTGMIIQRLRAEGFSDEVASQVMQSVDPQNVTSQQEYIEKLEEAVEKAVAKKNYMIELNKARDEGRAFAEVQREFENPFGDDEDEVDTAVVAEPPVEDPAASILASMFGGGNDDDEDDELSDSGSDYYFQLVDPTDPNAPDWTRSFSSSDFGINGPYCHLVILPKNDLNYDQHISDYAGGNLVLDQTEFEEIAETEFIYYGDYNTGRAKLLAMGLTENNSLYRE